MGLIQERSRLPGEAERGAGAEHRALCGRDETAGEPAELGLADGAGEGGQAELRRPRCLGDGMERPGHQRTAASSKDETANRCRQAGRGGNAPSSAKVGGRHGSPGRPRRRDRIPDANGAAQHRAVERAANLGEVETEERREGGAGQCSREAADDQTPKRRGSGESETAP